MPRHSIQYPMGSVSSGTMRPEDLIPTFASELESLAKQSGIVAGKQRQAHCKLVRDIEQRVQDEQEFEDLDLGIGGSADDDLDALFAALGEYAAPYFYFGAHPGDGADYGFWLSEDWDQDFPNIGKLERNANHCASGGRVKVADLADVPKWFRGEVAVVNDHGNVTLYVKTARQLREIWSLA